MNQNKYMKLNDNSIILDINNNLNGSQSINNNELNLLKNENQNNNKINEDEFSEEKKDIHKVKKLVINNALSDFFIILMTIISKIINIIFSVLIARRVSKTAYAVVNIYLFFIYTIIISFPREVLRNSISSFIYDETMIIERKKYNDCCLFIFIINCLITFLSIFIYYFFVLFNKNLNKYKVHIILYILSGILENYVEPCVIYMNVKLVNFYKIFILFFKNYFEIIITFIFCYCLKFDLWCFTLARILTSVIYFTLLLYISFKIFKLEKSSLYNLNLKFLFMFFFKIFIKEHWDIINYIYSGGKTWFINLFLLSNEKIILTFFVSYSEEIKAEYYFVKSNFSYFIDNFIALTGNNFFLLLNTIKNYKHLILLKKKEIATKGDFSYNDNQYILPYLNKNNYYRKKETYSYNLLKSTIKYNLIMNIIIISIISLFGEFLVNFLFTDKWANENIFKLMKIYIFYLSLSLLDTSLQSYSSAIHNQFIRKIVKSLNNAKIFLLLSLSFSLTQIDISGLIYSNIIACLFTIISNWYLSVRNEYYDENNKHNNLIIFKKMIVFLKESSIKLSSLCSCILCLVLCFILKLIENKIKSFYNLYLLGRNIIIICNILLLIFFEKEDFIYLLKLKIQN